MKIRLQVGVAVAFTILSFIAVGVSIGFFYDSNKTLALQTANVAMRDSEIRAESALLDILAPVGRVVNATAAFVTAFPDEARTSAGMAVLNDQIDGLRHVYGIYFGLENNGEFYQVVRLPETLRTFGPSNNPLPDGTKLVFRSIDSVSGVSIDRYLYQSTWGTVTGEEIGQVNYNPRQRPWYMTARDSDRIVVSPIYAFASTGRPGITFSKRILSPTGRLFGVVGIDITLDALATALDQIKVGNEGRAFLLDQNAVLFAQSTGEEVAANAAVAPGNASNARPFKDPVIEAAIKHWKENGVRRFNFSVPGSDNVYLASVSQLPEVLGLKSVLGFVVAESEFIGRINRSTKRVLQWTGLILAISILATILLSRLLSRQIQLVAEEARRIKVLNLEGDFQMESHITEVNDLSDAVASMKGSLRSFGKYVPKYLVREIVKSGTPPQLGGQQRDISMLFTDLEGFTRWSQKVRPEVLANDLSHYLTGVCNIIEARNGVVDKFVGDAVMAYWNAPVAVDGYVEQSCLATLECRDWANNLMRERDYGQEGEKHFYTRFGLHAGEVFVGNVGSDDRMDYTVVGAPINLGSRLEPLNKRYGTQILASEEIVRRCENHILFRWIDTVLPVGALKAIDVYELVAVRPDWSDAPLALMPSEETVGKCDLWGAVKGLYRDRRWDDLIDLMSEHEKRFGRDGLTTLYTNRAKEFKAAPPPPDWNYITVYLSKR